MLPNSVNRREVLATAGGAVLAGLAGCSGLTQQSFEATPVVLPESPRQELVLAETGRNSETITRKGPSGNVEVTITSHAAVYQRGSARGQPTLLEKFVGSINGTEGAGAAINVVASDLGIQEANPEFLEGDTPVSGDYIMLLVPEQARGDGGVHLDELLAIHHADALPMDELTSSSRGFNYLVDIREAIPDRKFLPSGSGGFRPDERWIPGMPANWLPDDPTQLRCLVCLGERSPQSVFGIDEMPGRQIDEGETVDTEDTIVFMPAPKENPTPDPGVMDPSRVFDAGHPSPMGGPTYALGVLATPDVSIAGQSANPLVDMDTAQLLQRDAAKQVLAETGWTDADSVEWLAQPIDGFEEPELLGIGTDETELLGTGTDPEVFIGVVSGENRPWGVFLTVARITDDDHVVAVAGTARPVGTVEGGMELMEPERFMHGKLMEQFGKFTAKGLGALRRT